MLENHGPQALWHADNYSHGRCFAVLAHVSSRAILHSHGTRVVTTRLLRASELG